MCVIKRTEQSSGNNSNSNNINNSNNLIQQPELNSWRTNCVNAFYRSSSHWNSNSLPQNECDRSEWMDLDLNGSGSTQQAHAFLWKYTYGRYVRIAFHNQLQKQEKSIKQKEFTHTHTHEENWGHWDFKLNDKREKGNEVFRRVCLLPPANKAISISIPIPFYLNK